MSTTLSLRTIITAVATIAFLAMTPLAFAEENGSVDYEAKAEAKIQLVGDMLQKLDDEDAAEVSAYIDEAMAYLAAGDYEDAYEQAVEAYEEATEALAEDDDEMDEKDEDEKDEDDDEKDYDKDKDYEKERKYDCKDSDTRRECVKDTLKEKREARCEALAEDDASKERKFCRDGEWKEKRDARLDDIMNGFIEAADLDEEAAEAIRAEVQSLIRQLIMLMLSNR